MKRFRQRTARGLIRFGLLLISGLVRFLPLGAAVRIGRLLGRWADRALVRENRKVVRHLRLAFGPEHTEEELRRTARDCFAHLGQSLFELLWLQRVKPGEIKRYVEMDETPIREALSKGKGLIFITGHIGNWELLGAAVAACGFPLQVVAAPLYDPWIDDWVVRLRSRMGVETVSRGEPDSGRRILRTLRENGILGILIDQDIDAEGGWVDFFGRPAYTPTGAAALAARTGAPVVVGYIHRIAQPEDHGIQHRVAVHGPWFLDRDRDQSQVMAETQRFTELLEHGIRLFPEQWVWMHSRWKTQ
jgi:KDO2-lipid IV(A) lauroyltransferase